MTASNRAAPPLCEPRTGICHLCGDEGSVGRVTAIDAATRTATVSLDRGSATVALDLVDAAVGDELLVHLGFAISRVGQGAA